MYLEANKIFKGAGYEKTCHNRFSRIPEDFKEPCMEIVGTGSGFFMGNIGRFSYTDIEPSDRYMDMVSNEQFPISKLSISSVDDEMGKMMMRLYIRLPVNKLEFKNRFGKIPEEVYETTIKRLEKKGLIEVDEEEIKLTKLGDIWRYNISWEFTHPENKSNLLLRDKNEGFEYF
jgi:oxygen-independent coproporphyrinogen-3 oxidase